MTTETQSSRPASTPKGWSRSTTVWGILCTAATTLVPQIAPLFGVELPPDVVAAIGTETIALIQLAGGLMGTVVALVGRARARGPLTLAP